jgi:predicted RNA-binding protein with TRAM domain
MRNKISDSELSMSYRYGRRNFGSKPVEVGKGYNIQIKETSRKGDGIARI